ncbi:MAG: hypothetical protein LBD72_02825 [Puniceicoccales bacterium]|jgi:lipase chaperone LimK|nr:hypothetical protein [Puniceicoccales bacterium]
MDSFSEQTRRQIEKNEQLIAEAKATIQKMRDFWGSLGADLDSGENIFLNSPHLTPESRQQAVEAISKMEKEYESRYRHYRATRVQVAGEADLPETFRAVMSSKPVAQGSEKVSSTAKKRVKKMRIG